MNPSTSPTAMDPVAALTPAHRPLGTADTTPRPIGAAASESAPTERLSDRKIREGQFLGLDPHTLLDPDSAGKTHYRLSKKPSQDPREGPALVITPAQLSSDPRGTVWFQEDGKAFWGTKRTVDGTPIQTLKREHEEQALHYAQHGRDPGNRGVSIMYHSVNDHYLGEGIGRAHNGALPTIPANMTIRRLQGFHDADGRQLVVVQKKHAVQAIAAFANDHEYLKEVWDARVVPWMANTKRPSLGNLFRAPRFDDASRLPERAQKAVDKGLVYGSYDVAEYFPRRISYLKDPNQRWVENRHRDPHKPVEALPRLGMTQQEYADAAAASLQHA